MTSPRLSPASTTLLLAFLAAASPSSPGVLADDAPTPRPERASPEDRTVADKLARCAANYTFQVRMLKVAGGKTDALAASMDWHWEQAIALSDEAYAKERLEVHYRSYMALDREFAKIDVKKEPERAKAEVARIFATLNADSDDCDLLRKSRMRTEAARLEQQCAEGAAGACNDVALLLQKGVDVPKDSGRAAALFLKACDGGFAPACGSLALLHAKGEGVPKDTARAASLYGKACDAGRTVACNNLGVLYFTGDGVPKDAARAAVLYDKACREGNARGCSNLGNLYKTGEGVGADPARAAALLQKACDGGYAHACGGRDKAGTTPPARPPGDS